MAGIFISYRREDSAAWARLLYDWISKNFATDQICLDVDSIPLGVDFVQVIEKNVGSCDAFVAVIGQHWLSCVDEEGKRRIDKLEDLVRVEIGAALKRQIRVIPVLVDGARMPRSEELPGPLAKFAQRNALELSHTSFTRDVERLVKSLRDAVAERTADGARNGSQTRPRPAQRRQLTRSETVRRKAGKKRDSPSGRESKDRGISVEPPVRASGEPKTTGKTAKHMASVHVAAPRSTTRVPPKLFKERPPTTSETARAKALSYFSIGVARREKSDLRGAIAAYREALKLEPHDTNIIINLGCALEDKGDLEQAIAAYRKVLRLDPDYAAARAFLERALARHSGKKGRFSVPSTETSRATPSSIRDLILNSFRGQEHVFIESRIPDHKLRTALTSYAPNVNARDVVVFYDDTLWGGAKDGMLLTASTMFWKGFLEKPQSIALKDVKSVTRDGTTIAVNDKNITCTGPKKETMLRTLEKFLEALARHNQSSET